MNVENELPDGWVWTTLGDVGRWSGGGTPSKAKEQFWADGNIPWVSPKDMKTLRIIDTEDHLSTIALEETSLKLYPVGTILLVVRSGILQRTLPVAISQVPLTMNQDMKGINPIVGIDPMYIVYYLISSEHDILSRCSKDGTTVASIDSESLKIYPTPLPPSTEQQRIVSAIEQQFTRLDAAVAALRRAQAKLKRYRAAVLKAVVEGKLTEAWRAKHPTTEPAPILLERILKERHAKWEVELRAKGKDPAKVKYVEPAKPDIEGLPELPEEWCWAVIDQIITNLRNGLSQKPESSPPGHRILRINAVRPMKVNLDEVRYLSLSEKDAKDYFLDNGDILFTRYNGSLELLGVAGKVHDCFVPTLHPDKLIRVKTVLAEPLSSYIELASNVGASRTYIESKARTTAGQTGISGSDIQQMPIPLPSLTEQEQIVAEVEQRLSVVSQLEAIVEANLKRAERLRQSILKEAFAGRLVPQDPNDEPASVLLERIRKERDGRKKGTVSNGRYVSVSNEPVQIDLEGARQVELWDSIGG